MENILLECQNKKRIAIIGLGRMGCCIARKICHLDLNMWLYDIDQYKTQKSKEFISGDNVCWKTYIQDAINAEYVILALAPNETIDFLNLYEEQLSNCNIVFVLARLSEENRIMWSKVNICRVKIIGEAEQINKGERPYIVVQDCQYEKMEIVSYIWGAFGKIRFSGEKIFNDINKIAAKEILVAIERVKIRLLGEIDEEILKVLINNVMAGTCNGYPWELDDGFINGVKAEIVNETNNKRIK